MRNPNNYNTICSLVSFSGGRAATEIGCFCRPLPVTIFFHGNASETSVLKKVRTKETRKSVTKLNYNVRIAIKGVVESNFVAPGEPPLLFNLLRLPVLHHSPGGTPRSRCYHAPRGATVVV